jgi:hypothetical protein
MTRFQLAISLAALALSVGCGDRSGECPSNDCDGSVDNGDDGGEDQFSATIRSVAPYGWSGDHYIKPVDQSSMDPNCTDAVECDVDVGFETQKVTLWDWGMWRCVAQELILNRDQDGDTLSIDWTGEGICGLTPDGDYSGWNVHTDICSSTGTDQVCLYLDSWESIVTGNTFFYDDGDYLLEGTIEEDLSSITYYLGAPGTSGGDQTTLTL